ncbi:MAG: M56 family metallopeptidase [Parachlamydiaceae bacterium]|nr:M56 family metallopeptidase [Parachlamydiaceae bacterium]
MVTNPLYLLSFIFSTILAFFTTALLVHCFIYFFKIRNYRARYILRILPFATPLLDFLALEYNISNWLNPLSCSSCLQKAFLGLFYPELQAYLNLNEISLIDYFHYDSYIIGLGLTVLIGSISTYFICQTLIQLIFANRYLTLIIGSSISCIRPIMNTNLKSMIEFKSTRILLSKEIHIPMATPYNAIVMPFEISQFSQEEFEAIIAHECEHVTWRDPQIKIAINAFRSLFWWIPVKNWINKMEEDQEMASDQGILKHDFSEEFLASALVKVAIHVKNEKLISVCHLSGENSILRRVKALMNRYPKENFSFFGVLVLILALALLLVCAFT